MKLNLHQSIILLSSIAFLGCAGGQKQTQSVERKTRLSSCMAYQGNDLKDAKSFAALDANGDGSVDKEEYYCAVANHIVGNGKMLVDPLIEHKAAAFEKADIDSSGSLTAKEFKTLKPLRTKSEKMDFVCVSNQTSQDLGFRLFPMRGPQANETIEFKVRAGKVFCDPSHETRSLFRLELQDQTDKDQCDSAVAMVDGESLRVQEGADKSRNCQILSEKVPSKFSRVVVVKNTSKGKVSVAAVGKSCKCASFKPASAVIAAGAEKGVSLDIDTTGKCQDIQSECDLKVTAEGMPSQELNCVGLFSEVGCLWKSDKPERMTLRNGATISVTVE